MAITRDQAVQEMVDRKLSPRHVEGVGWVVDLGGRRVRSSPAATPEAAIEAAVAELTAREAGAAERSARVAIAAQQRGNYYARPRRESSTDPISGESTESLVFDLFRADGTKTAIAGRRHVLLCWQDLAAARARGETP